MNDAFLYEPDPQLPGWHIWGPRDQSLFNAMFGCIHVRAVEENRAEVRLDPPAHLKNVMGGLHGGALLGFLDIALFGGSAALDVCEAGSSVTVEVNSHFLSSGKLGTPIIAEFEVMRSTYRLLFVRGVMRQEERVLLNYSAIIRKGARAS